VFSTTSINSCAVQNPACSTIFEIFTIVEPSKTVTETVSLRSFAVVISLIISICFIASIYWPFAIFAIVVTPIIVYISKYFSHKLSKIYKERTIKRSLFSSWLFEVVKGMQEIKLFCALNGVLTDFVGYTEKIVGLQIKANRIEVVSERINSGVSLVWQLILYCVSAVLVITGNITLGGFTACVSYFGKCISSFNALNNHFTSISENMVSVDRVCRLLDEDSERRDGKEIEIKSGNIEFRNVYFSYGEESEVLKGINLKLFNGEKVALVGCSGAGKSTLANILLGFLELDRGQIYIDEIPITDFSLHSLRKQIGIVQQDTIIFDGSVRYNLVFSNSTMHDGEIIEVLKKTLLYDYVVSLPQGLDTILGSKGCQLSGGQKQRLALARIFLKDPRILIFDEATSSLDSESEQIIKEYWNSLANNRTMLIIAHRISTIIDADRIVVLQNGVIVGNGTHTHLLKYCKEYKKLFGDQCFV
jgi:ABC-type multidrug transport system fused ATPase/permease subunit